MTKIRSYNKIIFVSTLTIWSLKKGHGGPAFSQTIKKYVEENWEVFLITDEPANIDCDYLDDKHNIFISPTFFKRLGKIRKLGLLFRWINHLFMTEKFCKEIQKLIGKNTENTVLYAYEIFGVKACNKISKRFEIPFITRFQGTILFQYNNNLFNHIRWYPHYQALSQKADLTIMTDDGSKGVTVLRELGNNGNVLFLRNGLDLLEKDLYQMKSMFNRNAFRMEIGEIEENDCMFLTVSRLAGWKKVERAIDGFAEFIKRGMRGKLVIVGDGDTKLSLMKQAKDYGLEDKVIFTGSVAHDEVYKYMMACDIFMSLYDQANVGNPLLEAMTLGKCIVTLDVGDTKSLVTNGENAILLKMEDLPFLGKILVDLSQNYKLREQLGTAAACYAQTNFMSWKTRMNIEFLEVSKLLKTCDS